METRNKITDENPQVKKQLGGLDVNGRIILKWILEILV
jgi:hypothetical protein